MSNAHHCHRCDHLTRPGYTCAKTGRAIADHAHHGDCPLGKFCGPIPVARVSPTATPSLWRELHAYKIPKDEDNPDFLNECAVREWLSNWANRVPCGECRVFWRSWLSGNPPPLSSQEEFFAWTVAAHNAVNVKLGRREWTVEEARAIHLVLVIGQ